ncbi:MAG: hypothetical protein RL011_101 [Pseudomonadota bacterium]|jgi:2-polyprenyl-6-methoxyphenol hydroxylase-like FAD-dependent oxidoreductase
MSLAKHPKDQTVLISGAGIAGPTLAFWLKRHGFSTTIVERASELRLGGQNVDVRGAGRVVTRKMGIEDAIKSANTGELGVRFIDSSGSSIAEFPASKSESRGLTAELEILRGALAKILYNQTTDSTEYLFGDYICAIDNEVDAVSVKFHSGLERTFSLVIIADGIRSKTRELVFGGETQIRELGLYMAYLTIPRLPSDSNWALWQNATGGRAILLRPDNIGTMRASLSFLSPPCGHESLEQAEQKQVLKDKFRDAGGLAPRILDALDKTPELYMDSIGQVKAPHWSRGRVALLGDAGYCPSPISGMGTSLAFVGAYVLAGELARASDYREAFANYERIMRPYVENAQQLAPGTPRLAHPKTQLGIRVFNQLLRLAASPTVSAIGRRISKPKAERVMLPEY